MFSLANLAAQAKRAVHNPSVPFLAKHA